MRNNKVIYGIILVTIGATSYGMLATYVKLAYLDGFTTFEVTVSQFIYGILGLLIINYFQKIRNNSKVKIASKSDVIDLMLGGTSLGMTSVFYYLCVKYIDVSIAIVLLMQTVWLAVILEWIIDKKPPSIIKITAVVIILIGTILATNVFNNEILYNYKGVLFGFLAAISFTATMFTANKIATNVSSSQRTLYMLLGGAVIVFGFGIVTQNTMFNYQIFIKWGLFLGLFGTIIPPMLMNTGFPLTGIGLGSIVSALELPVSILMAFFILNEKIIPLQWFGVLLIIAAIVIINSNFKKSNKN